MLIIFFQDGSLKNSRDAARHIYCTICLLWKLVVFVFSSFVTSV